MAHRVEGRTRVGVIFRDEERGSVVSMAVCDDVGRGEWKVQDLSSESVGMWEPTYDASLWARSNVLHLFIQRVGQGDAERVEQIPPQMVSILEWTPAGR
jgi:hypothetical protein